MEWEGGLKKMSRRFSVVKNTPRRGARAYARAAQREKESEWKLSLLFMAYEKCHTTSVM